MRLISVLPLLLSLTPFPALAAGQFESEQAAQRHCPDDTVVWLNLRSGNAHVKGMKWYGKTQSGAYVCKQELAARTRNGENQKQALWHKVMEDEDRTTYASAPLERKGSKVTVVSLSDLKKASRLGEGKEFLSWETQYEFDCKQKQSRVVAASMYAGNMGEGEVTDSVVYEAPGWEPVPAGSNGETLWKLACSKK